jgi:Flp pilus assembly protein TadD
MSIETTVEPQENTKPQAETPAPNGGTNNGTTASDQALDQLLAEGKQRFQDGDVTGAADCFRQMVALNRKTRTGWNNLGVTMHVMKKWSEAVEAFANALALDPNDTQIRHNLRTLLMGTDNSGRVDADVLVKYGEALFREGRIEDAHEQFELAIQSDPRNAEAWNNLGVTRFQLGNPEGAEASFANAVALNPNDVNARNNQAKLMVHNGRVEEASRLLENTLLMLPNDLTTRDNLVAIGALTQDEAEVIAGDIEIKQACEVLARHAAHRIQSFGYEFRPIGNL